jgi:hypothetical protein
MAEQDPEPAAEGGGPPDPDRPTIEHEWEIAGPDIPKLEPELEGRPPEQHDDA